MNKSKIEGLKQNLEKIAEKGNYYVDSINFSGYSAQLLLNEIKVLEKRGENGKAVKRERRRFNQMEGLARNLTYALEEALNNYHHWMDVWEDDTLLECEDTLAKAKEVLGDVE